MLTMTFTNLTSGWLDVSLRDGDRHATVSASYLTNAPAELVQAVLALVQGCDVAKCVWVGEPEEYLWFFSRRDAQVGVEVLWFSDDAMRRHAVEEGKPVFNTACALEDLVAAVTSLFDALKAQLGEDGYRRRWQHPFPEEALAALRVR